MSSYQQSSKYKLVVSEFGSSFQVAIEDTTQSGTAIQDDIDNFELHFLTEVTGFTVSANKNHTFISDGGESSSSNFEWIQWNFYEAVDGTLTPPSFSTTTYQMVLATFTPPTPDITLDAFKAMIDINHTRIIDFPESVNYPTNIYSLQHDGGFGGDGNVTGGVPGGDGPRYVLEPEQVTLGNGDPITAFGIKDTMPSNETEDFTSITLDFGSNTLTKSEFLAFVSGINDSISGSLGGEETMAAEFLLDDGETLAGDAEVFKSIKFIWDGTTPLDQQLDDDDTQNGEFLMAVHSDVVSQTFSMTESFYENGAGATISYGEGGDTGTGTGTTEPTITYTHIGNAGGTSGG